MHVWHEFHILNGAINYGDRPKSADSLRNSITGNGGGHSLASSHFLSFDSGLPAQRKARPKKMNDSFLFIARPGSITYHQLETATRRHTVKNAHPVRLAFAVPKRALDARRVRTASAAQLYYYTHGQCITRCLTPSPLRRVLFLSL